MKRPAHIPGAVLPTVMVVSTLLALTVLAVISLWEADFLYFSRHNYKTMVRTHIASGFTLYAEYPDEVMSGLDGDSMFVLYDSIPHSRIGISRTPHGLYEKVTIASHDGRDSVSKILGLHTLCPDDFVLYCPDHGSSVTLAGKTHLKGCVCIPEIGIVYGQIGADFFRGDEIPPAMMTPSENELPSPSAEALAIVEGLMALATEEIEIDDMTELSDTVIVARKVRIAEGFSGSVQIFASDSITVAANVTLDYPSGLYSEKHVTLGEGSTVNGYVIVAPLDSDETDVMQAGYVQSRKGRVRGLVYVDGMAQIQGIVSGVAMLSRPVYYSPSGYYENMFYDLTILENTRMAWPLWLEESGARRKEIKWLD